MLSVVIATRVGPTGFDIFFDQVSILSDGNDESGCFDRVEIWTFFGVDFSTEFCHPEEHAADEGEKCDGGKGRGGDRDLV